LFVTNRSLLEIVSRSRLSPRISPCLCAVFAAATLALSGCSSSPFARKSDAPTVTAAQQVADAAQRAAEEKKPALARGDDAVTRGDFAAAAAFYRSAQEADPKAQAPLRRLGAAEFALGQYTEAYETYHALQEIVPDDSEAAFRMGELVLMRGSPQAAIDQFTIALSTRKDDPALYSVVGVAYSMMGKYDLAVRSYQAGLKLVPDHQGLRNNLGLAQFLAGDSKAAIQTFTDLVALPDSKLRYRQNLAFIYAVNGDMAKAREIAGKDVDIATLDSDLKNFRAQQKPDGVVIGDDRTMMGIHLSRDAAAQTLTATVAADQQRQVAADAAAAEAARAQQAAADTAAAEAAKTQQAAADTAAAEAAKTQQAAADTAAAEAAKTQQAAADTAAAEAAKAETHPQVGEQVAAAEASDAQQSLEADKLDMPEAAASFSSNAVPDRSETPQAVLGRPIPLVVALAPIPATRNQLQGSINKNAASNKAATLTLRTCIPTLILPLQKAASRTARRAKPKPVLVKNASEVQVSNRVSIYIPSSSRGPGFFLQLPRAPIQANRL
jgi:Flp pilus assembly protein TadD